MALGLAKNVTCAPKANSAPPLANSPMYMPRRRDTAPSPAVAVPVPHALPENTPLLATPHALLVPLDVSNPGLDIFLATTAPSASLEWLVVPKSAPPVPAGKPLCTRVREAQQNALLPRASNAMLAVWSDGMHHTTETIASIVLLALSVKLSRTTATTHTVSTVQRASTSPRPGSPSAPFARLASTQQRRASTSDVLLTGALSHRLRNQLLLPLPSPPSVPPANLLLCPPPHRLHSQRQLPPILMFACQ